MRLVRLARVILPGLAVAVLSFAGGAWWGRSTSATEGRIELANATGTQGCVTTAGSGRVCGQFITSVGATHAQFAKGARVRVEIGKIHTRHGTVTVLVLEPTAG